MIKPILTYGRKSWTTKAKRTRKIKSIDNNIKDEKNYNEKPHLQKILYECSADRNKHKQISLCLSL